MLICNFKLAVKLSHFDKFSLTSRISDSILSFLQFDKSETLTEITGCYERSIKATNELWNEMKLLFEYSPVPHVSHNITY